MRQFFLLLFIINCTNGFAQFFKVPDDVKSPTAASIAKYGDVEVSLANGTADIEVPLHRMVNGQSSLDIKLRYDTSGFRINSPSGIVGMNWNLEAGGVITRSIRGSADEETTVSWETIFVNTTTNQPEKLGYFYRYGFLQNLAWNSSVVTNYIDAFSPTDDIIPTNIDTQPDIFTFHFMNFSGRFFLGEDGTWKVQSDANLEVLIDESDFVLPLTITNIENSTFPPRKSFGKITLRDDVGTRYNFGVTQNAVEYTCTNFYNQRIGNTYPSAWYLQSVVDRNGITLYSFSYERGKPIAFLDSTRSESGLVMEGEDSNFQCVSGSGAFFRGMGSLISPVYLTAIDSRNESLSFSYSASNTLEYKNEPTLESTFLYGQGDNNTVVFGSYYWWDKMNMLTSNFYLDTANATANASYLLAWNTFNDLLEWRKLDKITIKKNYGTSVKEVRFAYHEQPTERLFLDQVEIENVFEQDDYQKKYKYDFEYFNRQELPEYLFKAVDHWGYLNGTVDISNYSTEDYFAAREPSDFIYYKRMGMLEKITYPTGGYTTLTYESNDYAAYQGFSGNEIQVLSAGFYKKLAGGLRIQKLSDYPLLGNPVEKEYLYTPQPNSGISSGTIEYKPSYYHISFQAGSNPDIIVAERNTNAIIPLTNTFGAFINYSRVFEKKTVDGESYLTEFNFTDHSQFPDINYFATSQMSHSILDEHISRAYMRGKLKSKIIYGSAGLGDPKKSEEYIYRNSSELEQFKCKNLDVTNQVCVKELEVIGIVQFWARYGNATVLYFGDYDVVKTITKEHFGNQIVQSEQLITKEDLPYYGVGSTAVYTGNRRTLTSSITNSNGDQKVVQNEYLGNCDNLQPCFNETLGLIKEVRTIQNSELIASEKLSYSPINSINSSLQISSIEKLKGNSLSGEIIDISQYDTYGNIVEYSQNNGTLVCLIYDRNGADLLGKIENISYSQLTQYLPEIQKTYNSSSSDAQAYTGNPVQYFATRGSEIQVKFNEIRNQFPGSFVTSYTYDLYHRISTMTDPKRQIHKYYYDGLDRLVKITDEGGNILSAWNYNMINE